MESRVATLEVKVDVLEKRSDEHERDDDRTHKYMTHMMEDLLSPTQAPDENFGVSMRLAGWCR